MDVIIKDEFEEKKRTTDSTSYVSAVQFDYLSDDEWRNIIFLPFDKRWEGFIIIFLLMDSFRIVHEIFFGRLNTNTRFIISITELLYAIDTVLSIMHRNMKNHSKKRKFKQKNLLLITIDVLTLLPFIEIYELVMETSQYKVNEYYEDLVNSRDLLRLYRIFIYFTKLRNTAGLNQLLIVSLYLTIRIFFIILAIASVLYLLQDGKAGNTKLGNDTYRYRFETEQIMQVFVTFFVTAGSMFMHGTSGFLGVTSPDDIALIIISTFCGYLFTIMIAYGELTSVYVKKLTRHFQFTWKYHIIEKYLDEWDVPQQNREKLVIFYRDFWKRRRGIIKLPKVMNLLPINLQKDILLDLSWEALKHSHLFAGEDMAFKKALSMHMIHKYYLRGDIIFKTGNTRSEMIYINSGIVQVLSDEDDESPILSFSNGTLLGESCCLMYHKTKAILRCTTNCEIQVLNFTSFYKTLLLFPKKSKNFRDTYHNRLHKAKIGLKIIQRDMELKKFSLVLPETTIKSLKKRWRLISSMHKDLKKPVNITEFGEMDGVHTSEYLNTLVLTDDVDLKLKAIFLTKRFPFILDPDSDIAICWRYATLITILMMDILLPLYTCFGYDSSFIRTIISLLDIMYVTDIFVQVSTAIKLKQQTITKMSQIALKRASKLAFLVDIVTALPLDYYLSHLTDVSENAVHYLKLTRLLKTYRIIGYLFKVQDNNWHNPMMSRIIKFSFIGSLMIYFSSALHYSIKCHYFKHCDYYAKETSQPSNYIWRRLLLPIFYVTSYLVGLHVNDDREINLFLFAFSYFLTFVGFMFLNIVFSEICALFVLKDKHENEYNVEMNILRSYLVSLHLPKTIFKVLQDYLMFMWKYNKNTKILGPNSIMKELPSDLSDVILKQAVVDMYRNIPAFVGLSDKFYTKLYKHTVLYSVPPNMDLLNSGAEAKYLRIILRGYCKMYSYMPTDKAYKKTKIISCGDAFPILEFFHGISSFLKVVTITAVDIFYIESKHMWHAMQFEHDQLFILKDVLHLHITKYGNILLKKPGRLPELFVDEKSYGRGNFFTYAIAGDVTEEGVNAAESEEIEKTCERNLGKFVKILRVIMLRRTIYPQSKVYFAWEILVCISTIIGIMINLTSYNIYGAAQLHYDKSGIISIVIYIILVFDMYVRFHMQYYNKKGLLVTHHYFTAKHYIKTSFAADVIIIIPYKALQLTRIFGKNRMYLTEVCVSSFFKMLRLYHVFGLLSYFQEDSSKRLSTLINVTKIVIIILVTLLLFTNIYLFATCWFDDVKIMYKCPEGSWLTTTFDPFVQTAWETFIWALFVVITGFTTAVTGSFQLTKLEDIFWFLIMVICGIIIRTFFVALITSTGISGYTSLNKYQQMISVFLKFVKNEAVDEDLIKETINYYEYLFRKTKGKSFREFANTFYLSLSNTFTSTIIVPTLENVQLFRNISPGFLRAVTKLCELTYYKKDTPVIRCNDVQDNLFIIHKGTVNIVIAGQGICTLNRGGVFGNFWNKSIRQTISALTAVHTELLVINSNKFHKLMESYPNLVNRIHQVNELGCEFWESNYEEQYKQTVVGQQSNIEIYSAYHIQSTGPSKIHSKSVNFLKHITKNIDHTCSSYQMWQQFMDFHLAAISSIIFTYCIFMAPLDLKLIFDIFKYSLDALYLTNFYFGFRVTYTDTESGLTITESKLIAKRYLKSYFILDVITIIPLSLIYFLSINEEVSVFRLNRYLSINKILRILYVIVYYERNKFKLKDMTLIRFCCLIYLLVFVIQSLTSLWYITWCWGHKCSLVTKQSSDEEIEKQIKSPFFSNLMGYYYVINIFTQSCLKAVRATNYPQLLVTIILIFVTQYITSVLARAVASYLVIKYSTMSSYEFAIQELQQYLKSRELSPSILKKTWQYLLDLWFIRKGQQLPVIIQYSPSYLKQDLMYAMYGKHLENHYLFCNTHVDFLRQLVCHLRPCIFFPNNIIVEKYELDSTMYFIHSGEIEVIDVMGKNLFLHNVLTKDRSFGEAQGLYNIPHAYSYKAITVCDVLLLRKCDWYKLLEWFPASKEKIYDAAKENLIQIPAPNRNYNLEYDMDFTF